MSLLLPTSIVTSSEHIVPTLNFQFTQSLLFVQSKFHDNVKVAPKETHLNKYPYFDESKDVIFALCSNRETKIGNRQCIVGIYHYALYWLSVVLSVEGVLNCDNQHEYNFAFSFIFLFMRGRIVQGSSAETNHQESPSGGDSKWGGENYTSQGKRTRTSAIITKTCARYSNRVRTKLW